MVDLAFISPKMIQEFDDKIYIPHIYENSFSYFLNLEFNFLSEESDYIYLPVFQSYSNLPFVFSKRLFYLMSNNKQNLCKNVFLKNISLICLGSIDEKVKFLFDYLSFENEMINKNDLSIFLNNLVLDLSANFQENEKNLEIYINYIFSFSKKKDKINYDEFKNILSNYDSGLFYIFYLYFMNYKNFNEELLTFLNSLLSKLQKKTVSVIYNSPKSIFENSTLITISDIQIDNNDSKKQKGNQIYSIPKRKTSSFNYLKRGFNLCKNIQINFCGIIKSIFFQNDKYNEIEKILKNNIIEENKYSDDDSLNELNTFEKDFAIIKNKTFNQNQKLSIITQSISTPENMNKYQLKRIKTITSSNSKSVNSEYNEYDSVFVQIKNDKKIHLFHYILFQNYLFLFKHQKIMLIPYKRLFVEQKENVIIKLIEYYCLEFYSSINEFSFYLYFDDKFKLSLFNNMFKQNLPSITDSYELYKNKIIGKGTFSTVYLCKKNINNKLFCMKEINRDFNNESPNIFNKKLLNKEIDICHHFLKKINNPSIIHCEDIFETKNKVYIIFKYYTQGNLKKFLEKFYSFSVHNLSNDRIIIINNILNQLISTFKYIEKFGITHRDIKPENLLVSYSSYNDIKIHLIDFGFAEVGLYNQGMDAFIGTLPFTAPEIIMSNIYFRNVDTWSLGILAYNLLFDHLPFDIINEEDDINSAKRKILHNEFTFPYNRIDKNVFDKRIRNFMRKCLIKDNNKRPRISEIEYE